MNNNCALSVLNSVTDTKNEEISLPEFNRVINPNKNLPLVMPSGENIEVKSLKELDKNKIYHVAIDNANTHPSAIRMFADAAKVLDLKLLITIGDTTVETLSRTLGALSVEQKTKVLELLGCKTEINPVEHEQTK